MSDEYKDKSIEEIIDYLLNEEIGHIECDYEKVNLLLDCIKEKGKEIDRLNNIINQVVIRLEHNIKTYGDTEFKELRATVEEDEFILNQIKELKGENK